MMDGISEIASVPQAVTTADVACTVCGCVCDDLSVTVRDNRIVGLERACDLARPWFDLIDGASAAGPPVARIDGQPAELQTAIEAAARILAGAQSPLIYGLSRSSTDGQREAVELADRLGATIDTTASRCHAPSIVALQQTGESTCTLGEVRHRCDLVIFWGSNPVDSHPRHQERYSVDPVGRWIPGGREDRHVVVVDIEHTASAAGADTFLQVDRGSDFDVLWTLRALVRGLPVDRDRCGGVPLEQLVELAGRMKACTSGVVFFGLGLTRQRLGHLNVEALLDLVTDLNAHTRFHARRMRVPGDVTGADSVLCWQTGFPFSVSLSRGYPRYGPGEFSATEMLERGEVDACLVVGSESLARLSSAALDKINDVPSIVLDYPGVECPVRADIVFTTAVYGVHVPGTAYRMDEVPVPLRRFLHSPLPADADVLRQIAALACPPPEAFTPA